MRTVKVSEQTPPCSHRTKRGGPLVPLSQHPGCADAVARGLGHTSYCLEAQEGGETRGFLLLHHVRSLAFGNFLVSLPYLNYGGVQAAQYPLNIYAAWFRHLLTFGVPLACVAYYPVLAILKRPDPLGAPDWLLPLAPVAGFAFLALSFLAWRAGMARYASTGS